MGNTSKNSEFSAENGKQAKKKTNTQRLRDFTSLKDIIATSRPNIGQQSMRPLN